MAAQWESFFDKYVSKTVSMIDREKNAYSPNIAQQNVLGAAGFMPCTDDNESTFDQELHHGADRAARREQLRTAIAGTGTV